LLLGAAVLRVIRTALSVVSLPTLRNSPTEKAVADVMTTQTQQRKIPISGHLIMVVFREPVAAGRFVIGEKAGAPRLI
jgi:hypothetical protein